MQPLTVSVVIPTFNCASFLPEAVASALAQTVPPLQVIVVDDGSQDDTYACLAPWRDRITYIFQENQGVAAARNCGLAAAHADLIAFLDADDIWHPRKLEHQLAVLQQRPDLGLLGTATFAWPGPIPEVQSGPASLVEVTWPRLVVKNYFTTSSVVVRRRLLEEVGGFHLALHGPEDYDLWLRMAARAPVGNLNQPLTGYRAVPGSLSQQAVTMEAGMRRILASLDRQRRWSWKLRHHAYAYCRYSCAYMHGAAGHHGTALVRLLASFAWYPWPFPREEVRMAWARPRLLARTLLRWLRLLALNR